MRDEHERRYEAARRAVDAYASATGTDWRSVEDVEMVRDICHYLSEYHSDVRRILLLGFDAYTSLPTTES